MSEQTRKKICPRCGGEMKLEVKSYPMGSVFQLNRFQADIFRCSGCQKLELFAAERDTVTCPVCGTQHPAQERCFTCALDAAFGGAASKASQITDRKD